MILGIFGKAESNPVEEQAGKQADSPAECGYTKIPTVDWPATDPSTIKGRFFTSEYPADPYLEDDRELEGPDHEKGESSDYEKKEHT